MSKIQTYAEKLKHPKWQKKRLEILERDGFRCQWCSSKEKTLHVHHKTYSKGKQPWDYPEDNFLSLCEECHEEAEEIRNQLLLMLNSKWQFAEVMAIAKLSRDHDSYLCNVPSEIKALATGYEFFLKNMKEDNQEWAEASVEDLRETGMRAIMEISVAIRAAENKLIGRK